MKVRGYLQISRNYFVYLGILKGMLYNFFFISY